MQAQIPGAAHARRAGHLIALSALLIACERPLPAARSGSGAASDGNFEPAAAAAGTAVSSGERRRSEPSVRSNSASPAEKQLATRYDGAPAQSRFRGDASYYSNALAGRPTASGEPYDPRLPTAAHRSLPFGTVVRVIREDTGRVVYVRVNDRGPFVRGRVIDLSGSIAEELDMMRRGVVRVRVEVVELGPKRKPRRKRR